MNTAIKIFCGVIFIAALAGCGAQKNEQLPEQSAPGPEQYIEQASFVDLKGDSVHVSDFKGKVVLIDFWETWCRPCIASFPGINKLKKEYPDDFVVIAATPGFTDSKTDAQNFSDSNEYDFTYVMDTNGLHKKLNVYSLPYKVYIDASGQFIKSDQSGTAGPQGDYKKIKKIIEKHKKKEPEETTTQG